MAPDDFEFPRMTDLLERLDFRPSRHRDQHFLRNRGHARQIAEMAGLTPSHRVLEVGAGLGNLSAELAREAGAVVSVEKDRSFQHWHAELAAALPALHFVYADFLKVDLEEVLPPEPPGPVVAVGNLPYNITAPILFRLINSAIAWERLVVMVQLEVAERLETGPQTRQASALTYKIALEYDARIAMRLGAKEFIPPPRVRSAVVVLEPRAQRLIRSPEHKKRLHRLIGGVFTHRRRTLANALMLGNIVGQRRTGETMATRAGLDPMQRPESLSLEDFLRLEEQWREVQAP